jgi:hypothetical protein
MLERLSGGLLSRRPSDGTRSRIGYSGGKLMREGWGLVPDPGEEHDADAMDWMHADGRAAPLLDRSSVVGERQLAQFRHGWPDCEAKGLGCKRRC